MPTYLFQKLRLVSRIGFATYPLFSSCSSSLNFLENGARGCVRGCVRGRVRGRGRGVPREAANLGLPGARLNIYQFPEVHTRVESWLSLI
jgi:hypothetical protein